MLSVAQSTFGDKLVIELDGGAVDCILQGIIYCFVQE